jgi:hypothetical protein
MIGLFEKKSNVGSQRRYEFSFNSKFIFCPKRTPESKSITKSTTSVVVGEKFFDWRRRRS